MDVEPYLGSARVLSGPAYSNTQNIEDLCHSRGIIVRERCRFVKVDGWPKRQLVSLRFIVPSPEKAIYGGDCKVGGHATQHGTAKRVDLLSSGFRETRMLECGNDDLFNSRGVFFFYREPVNL